MSNRTLIGLEIVTHGPDTLPQAKVLAFLDYMRREASVRLGVPEQLIAAETRTIPIINPNGNVPEGRPCGSPSGSPVGDPMQGLPTSISQR